MDRIQRLAKRVLKQCLRIKRGEKILVEAIHLDDLRLPELLAIQCADLGAHPILVVRPEKVSHLKLLRLKPENLENYPSHDLCIYNNCDARVSCYSSMWPNWWRDIDEEKKAAIDRANLTLTNIAVSGKFRNLNITVPTKWAAKERKLDYCKLLRTFMTSVDVDYEKMSRLANKLKRKLKDAEEILIKSKDGTDIRFSTKGRTFLVEDGVISDEDMRQGIYYAEIPAGEVFIAPVEDSAEGKAIFPDVLEGRLELVFKGGKVVDARGKDARTFWERLKQATGDRDRIAEFAIGLNPGVPASNEKALGSIHIAIGKNNHIGGKNESSLHWDMIMPKPTIKADKGLIMDKGRVL